MLSLINQYLGLHRARDGAMFIVMEYLPLGSLRDLIINENPTLDTFELLGMAQQTAAGMLHLESLRIIHRLVVLMNL